MTLQDAHETPAGELLVLSEVMKITTLSRASIYREMQSARDGNGVFPPPIKIGRRSAWVREEIHQWIEERKAAR